MVNAKNLKRPAQPFIDTDKLVELGLLDPVYAEKTFDFGGLGFDPDGRPLPTAPTSTRVPFDVDPLRKAAEGYRSRQQSAMQRFATAQGTTVGAPEYVRPKRLNDSQAGIGAGVALLLKGLGASDKAVQGAFGSFVGSIVGRNEEEAAIENQKRQAVYTSQIDALKREAETSKLLFDMSGEIADDLDRQVKDLQDRNDALAKTSSETGSKILTAFQEAYQKGTLDPTSLRMLEQSYMDATGRLLFSDPGEREDAYREAEGNLRRNRGVRDAELTKKVNDATISGTEVRQKQLDLDFDLQMNPLKLRSQEADTIVKEIESRIATATEADKVRLVNAQASKAEADAEIAALEAKNKPTEINLANASKKASIAYTWKLISQVGKGGGSPDDAAKLEEAYLKAKDVLANPGSDVQFVNAENELKSIERAIDALVVKIGPEAARKAMPKYFSDLDIRRKGDRLAQDVWDRMTGVKK